MPVQLVHAEVPTGADLDGRGVAPPHPRPKAPRCEDFPQYSFSPVSQTTRLMAVESWAGSQRLFMSWDHPGRGVRPFWGNACMYLLPMITPKLPPGQTPTVQGTVGVTTASWKELSRGEV